MTRKVGEMYRKINYVFGQAPIADLGSPLTSKELVNDSELDAFYFRILEENNQRLNQNQIEAVRRIYGPLQIIAGAGSGKTSVLIARIGYMLIVENIDPSSILLVTFTKKAANEMRERLGRIPGITSKMKREIITGTFHSIFLKILRHAGYKQKILSNERYQQIVIKNILKEMEIQDDYQPESVLAVISHFKNQMVRPNDIDARIPIDKEIQTIYKKYEEWKENNNYMDFDDILLETYYLFQFEPRYLEFYQKKFKYIMVDEFQDTSYIQYELIKMISAPQNNLTVVGDDAQTIYGFRGASSSFILDFHKEFPNTSRVILDINYRSTDGIVGLGNEVIRHNKKQIEKQLKSMKPDGSMPMYYRPFNAVEEAKNIVDYIEWNVNSGHKKYSDFSILYRTHAYSRAIYDELVMRKIPFITYGKGNTFYQDPFVKPIIDILRLAMEPNNEDAIISVAPVFYLKRNAVKQALDQIVIEEEQYNKIYPNKLKRVLQMMYQTLKPFQIEAMESRIGLLDKLKQLNPSKAIKRIREGKEFAYDNYLEMNERKSLTMHKELVKERLDELESAAKSHATIDGFLSFIDEIEQMNREMEELRKNENADAVRLMTIHTSKGLEFDTVFLIGFIENVLPHKSALNASEQSDRIKENRQNEEAIEEERRLAYVAITRAKESLFLSAPVQYHEENADVSRFLLQALE